MTREAAKLELRACTLRPSDACDQARAMLATDSELAAWWQAEQALDQQIAGCCGSACMPADLVARLQGIRQQRAGLRIPTWAIATLATAAVITLSAVAWWSSWTKSGWQGQSIARMELIEWGILPLQHRSPDIGALNKTLADKQGQPVPLQISSSMGDHVYGCRLVQIEGRPATVVCFRLKSGSTAHLLVFNSGDLSPLPSPGSVDAQRRGSWSTVAWQEGGQTLMICAKTELSELQPWIDRHHQS
jgi:hypothetical protein